MKLPEPEIVMVFEEYEGWNECKQDSDWFQLKDKDSRMTAYTESQMRQAIRDALEEAIILNWTEIMREGALVTWGDAETLGNRVIARLDALKETI